MWQTAVTLLIVALAAAFVAWRAWAMFRGGGKAGCGSGCGSCPSNAANDGGIKEKPLVSLGVTVGTKASGRLDRLVRESALPRERIRFYATADRGVTERIDRGVLFVMAFWSGASIVAFRELTGVIARLDPEGRLELVVVDTDGCPQLQEIPELKGALHGKGETMWVRRGRVVRAHAAADPEVFANCVRDLLAA